MNGWGDLLGEALAALGDSGGLARANDQRLQDEGLKDAHLTRPSLISDSNREALTGGRRGETDKANQLDDADLRDALVVVEDAFAATDVIAITDRPSYRGHLLDDPRDFYDAVDRLDRETCRDSPCQPGHRCRRHSRRKKA